MDGWMDGCMDGYLVRSGPEALAGCDLKFDPARSQHNKTPQIFLFLFFSSKKERKKDDNNNNNNNNNKNHKKNC